MPRDDAPMTRGQGLNSKFSTVGSPWGKLGNSTQTVFSLFVLVLTLSFVFFSLTGDVSLRTGPPPPLVPFLPLVAAVFITPRGAESPDSGCVGVIGALVFFSF